MRDLIIEKLRTKVSKQGGTLAKYSSGYQELLTDKKELIKES